MAYKAFRKVSATAIGTATAEAAASAVTSTATAFPRLPEASWGFFALGETWCFHYNCFGRQDDGQQYPSNMQYNHTTSAPIDSPSPRYGYLSVAVPIRKVSTTATATARATAKATVTLTEMRTTTSKTNLINNDRLVLLFILLVLSG